MVQWERKRKVEREGGGQEVEREMFSRKIGQLDIKKTAQLLLNL